MKTLSIALVGCSALVAAARPKATLIISPSRVSKCGAQRGAWSALKFGSVILDEEAQQEGVSAALDGQTWSLINHRPVSAGGVPWPQVCNDLDEIIEYILEQAIGAASDAVTNIAAFIDQNLFVIDADAARLNFQAIAQRYAGAALVTPYSITIPGCVQPPFDVYTQNVALDIPRYIEKALVIFKNNKPCVSCLAHLVTEIFEIVKDGPADLAAVENVVNTLIDGSKRVTETVQALENAGNLPESIGEAITQTVPHFIDALKGGVGEGKQLAFLGFLGKVREEMKNEEIPKIDAAVEKYLKAQGC